jgi:hypothetical protein
VPPCQPSSSPNHTEWLRSTFTATRPGRFDRYLQPVTQLRRVTHSGGSGGLVAMPLCLKLRLISWEPGLSAWQVRAANERQGRGWHQQYGEQVKLVQSFVVRRECNDCAAAAPPIRRLDGRICSRPYPRFMDGFQFNRERLAVPGLTGHETVCLPLPELSWLVEMPGSCRQGAQGQHNLTYSCSAEILCWMEGVIHCESSGRSFRGSSLRCPEVAVLSASRLSLLPCYNNVRIERSRLCGPVKSTTSVAVRRRKAMCSGRNKETAPRMLRASVSYPILSTGASPAWPAF